MPDYFVDRNIKLGFTILLFLALFTVGKAQPPCATNPIADDFCASATPICNLNGYCGNTSAFYTNTVSPTNSSNETYTPLGAVFCATIQNNSWLKFIADSTIAIFDVWCSNCLHNHGIQMQIYATTNCYNFTSVSNCWNPQHPTNGQIVATGLTVGNTYYFMIDGTQGDVCDYVIACSVGVSIAPVISLDQTICAGQSATVSSTGGVTYQWSSFPPDPSLAGQQTNPILNVSPSVTTTYTVTVSNTGYNTFCTTDTTILSTVITVNNVAAQVTSVTSATCGQNNGAITVTGTGGISTSYSYLWNTTPAQSTPAISNLAGGTYTVTVTNAGCSVTLSQQVPLIPPPVASISNFTNAYCNLPNGLAVAQVAAGTPTFSYVWNSTPPQYTNVLQNVYGGVYTVSVTDQNSCVTTATVTITDVPVQPVTLAPLTNICENASPFTLSGNSPAGGWFTGTGVVGNTFDPALAGAGTYTITYHYTDQNSCTDSASKQIIVYPAPVVVFPPYTGLCLDAQPLALNTATPAGGTYSGPGIAGNVFDPASIGVGTYTITYTMINSYGCTDTETQSMQVFAVPVVTLAPLNSVCVNAGYVPLTGGSPGGGTYTGPGLIGTIFVPAQTGVGTFTLTYTYHDSHGCGGSQSQTITVVPVPVATLAPFTDVCEGSAAFTLTGGTPQGGVFLGTAVSNGMFDPVISGTGTFNIGYSFYDSVGGCGDTAWQTLTVRTPPTISFPELPKLCEGDDTLMLNTGMPTGGTYSGSGVAGSIFNPAVTGLGVFPITYTIQDQYNCQNDSTQNLTVYPLPEIFDVGGGGLTCVGFEGVPVDLDSSEVDIQYQLLLSGNPVGIPVTGTGSPITFGSQAVQGYYSAVATGTISGCTSFMSDSVFIGMLPTPQINMPAEVFLCDLPELQLDAGYFQDTVSYEWENGTESRYFTVNEPGTYTVKVSLGFCYDTASTEVKDCSDLWVPNVFTPNGSGGNETFHAKVTEGNILEYHLRVFDRWGKQMYASDNIDEGWDGKNTASGVACSEGTYFFLIRYKADAFPQDPKDRQVAGSVTLLR